MRATVTGPGGCHVTVDHDPAEGHHPTSRWQRGEFVIDRFKLRLPGPCRSKRVTLHVGFVGPGAPPYAGVSGDPDEGEGEGPRKGALGPPAGPPVAELGVK